MCGKDLKAVCQSHSEQSATQQRDQHQQHDAKLMHLRSRIGLNLQSLLEALPMFTEKDLAVVHRRTEKGLWRDEVWTNRPFHSHELQLGPFSSHLKDTVDDKRRSTSRAPLLELPSLRDRGRATFAPGVDADRCGHAARVFQACAC